MSFEDADNDRMKLQAGFIQDTTYDYIDGRNTSTLTGVKESAKAGGSFAVATRTPIESYDTPTTIL